MKIFYTINRTPIVNAMIRRKPEIRYNHATSPAKMHTETIFSALLLIIALNMEWFL
jgi:hypothetical protein